MPLWGAVVKELGEVLVEWTHGESAKPQRVIDMGRLGEVAVSSPMRRNVRVGKDSEVSAEVQSTWTRRSAFLSINVRVP